MELTPDLLLRAYAVGIFPMAESRRESEIHWIDPELRGVLPLEGFHVPRRLRRRIRRGDFRVTADTAFHEVIAGCAEPTPDRPDTWINPTIERLYSELADMGFAHSVECWQGTELVGGLYGVALGGAFFGESMFTRVSDASKVALVHLVIRLRLGGFKLLDTQFITPHLSQFGAIEIRREQYRHLLSEAIPVQARFPLRITAPQVEAFLSAGEADHALAAPARGGA
jgi:leucyl/phenylalanyl-tRNA--protein transferase